MPDPKDARPTSFRVAQEIAAAIGGSGLVATVVPPPPRPPVRSIQEAIDRIREEGFTYHSPLIRITSQTSSLPCPTTSALGTASTVWPYGFYLPLISTSASPRDRRRHAPGCRWSPGKPGRLRGWTCAPTCLEPARCAAAAQREDRRG